MRLSNNLLEAVRGLSLMDKLLPLLIILSMILGILLSVYVPSTRHAFEGTEIVGVSLPLAFGLIVMIIPPLCKVEWENFFKFFRLDKYLKPILWSLVINWIICPFLMFGLAWLTLFDQEEYRRGIIMIGLARCIAMVLIWNEISDGDSTLCAVIVLVNSLLQIVLYAPYQIFFCYTITGSSPNDIDANVSYELVARSVAFFLGIPLLIGVVVRFLGKFTMGAKYETKVLPIVGPWALIGLLYTIIVIFIEKGNDFIKDIGSALRCFIPLVIYFLITWFGTFYFMRWKLGRKTVTSETTELLCGCELQKEKNVNKDKWEAYCSAKYSEVITQTFTASSNNFELSLAISISLYGSGSKESIAATFGPLLEVPILLGLCFVARYLKFKYLWIDVDMEEDIDLGEETN